METQPQAANGKEKRGHSAASTSAIDPNRAADAYIDDAGFAATFADQLTRRRSQLREQLQRIDAINVAIAPGRQRTVAAVASPAVAKAASVPAKRGPKPGAVRATKSKVKAVVSAVPPAESEAAALKAIRAAGVEGIASRALGVEIGVRPGLVVKGLLESNKIRQEGTAGATRYFSP